MLLVSLYYLIRPRQHRRRHRQAQAFAVLRLITSSNFVGCSTGRSADRHRKKYGG